MSKQAAQGRSRLRRVTLTVGPLAATIALAGCSSAGGYGAAGSPKTSPASTTGGESITTATGSMGTYLTDGDGRAVYLWEGDSSGQSNCSGACASVWPPVTTTGTPQAEGSVKASDLSTITRSDGSTQVVYDGHPLYYFASDSGPGQVKGEGSDGFGAKWWLVTTSGDPITDSQSSPSQTTSSGGGYGY